MSCGPGAGLLKLKLEADKALGKVDEFINGEEGIFASLNNLATDLDGAIGDMAGSLKEMLPEIELPELPELGDIKLPELPAPVKKLHDDVKGILDLTNSGNPLDKLKAIGEINSLRDKYPNLTDEEFNKMKEDLLNGKISLDSICKLIPNKEVDPEGNAVEKAVPATAPEVDAENLKKEVEKVDPGALLDKVADLTGIKEKKKELEKNLEQIADLNSKFEDAEKKVKASMANFISF
jgi:hypothetical protein